MKLVEIVEDGVKHYINPEKIIHIYEYDNSLTFIVFDNYSLTLKIKLNDLLALIPYE